MKGRATTGLATLVLLACAGPPPGEVAPCPSSSPGVALSGEASGASRPGDPQRGRQLFETHCAECHGSDPSERGSRFRRSYPRLDCPDYLAGASDSYLSKVILEGGEAVGLRSVMRAFSEELSARDLADLLAFLRSSPRSGD